MLELTMALKAETKTRFRFDCRNEAGNLMTLYLQKADVKQAEIDPEKGVVVAIKEVQ